MIPQIANPIQDITYETYPTHTYRRTDTEIIGNVDGLEAMKQAVEHILSTERYEYTIYTRNYGIELNKYIGKGFGYLEATIEQTLQDALLQDDRIDAVTLTHIEKSGLDSALIGFTVLCNQGTFEMEVAVNV